MRTSTPQQGGAQAQPQGNNSVAKLHKEDVTRKEKSCAKREKGRNAPKTARKHQRQASAHQRRKSAENGARIGKYGYPYPDKIFTPSAVWLIGVGMPKIGQHNKFNNFLTTKIMRKMSVIEDFIANVGDITKLKGEVYNGTLDLRGVNVETLPENLAVTGSIILSRNKQITALPKGLSVGKILDLSETNIKTLPDDLKVGDDLILTNSAIEKLPDNLGVGRSLFLEGTQITELPEGLVVCNHLQMRKTKITTLPESLQVGGNVYVDRKAIVSIRHSQAEREKQLNIVAV